MSTDMFATNDFEFFTHGGGGDLLPSAAESSDFFSGFADWGQADALPQADMVATDGSTDFANPMLFDEGRESAGFGAFLSGGAADDMEPTASVNVPEAMEAGAGADAWHANTTTEATSSADQRGAPKTLPSKSSLSGAPSSSAFAPAKEPMPAPAPVLSGGTGGRHIPPPSPPSSQSKAPPPAKTRGVGEGQRSAHQIDAHALATLLKDSTAIIDKAASLSASSADNSGSGGVAFRSRGLSMLHRCREEVSHFQSLRSSALSASLDAVKTLAPHPALIEPIAGYNNATLAGLLYSVAPLPHGLDALRPKFNDILDRARAVRTAS